MHYLLSVIDDTTDSGTPQEMAAIDGFNDQLRADGHWIFAGGLSSPSTSTVVDSRNGGAMLTDGPFVETKEHVAGLWIIEAADLDVALELATEGSRACSRKLEVRPFLRD